MVLTVKFSDFEDVTPATIDDANEKLVGLENGVNMQSTRFLSWTTAGRPPTPFDGLLGLNLDTDLYEYWNSTTSAWVQLTTSGDISIILALLASHVPGFGAHLIGLEDQSHVTGKFVQDLANATFIAQTDNGTLQNAQFTGDLTTGIVANTETTGVLSISAPITSIDQLALLANQFLLSTSSSSYTNIGPLTNGQLIIGSTGVEPVLTTLTPGIAINITNSAGSITIDNNLATYATTVTAASTTVLTATSAYQQYFTGSTTQTVTLPVTSTLVAGQSFYIVNNSSGAVTVQSSGANTIQVMGANTTLLVTCILTSGTTSSSWNAQYSINDAIALPLSLTNGGTNAALTANDGGIVWSNATQLQILAGTATAGQMLQSGSTATPAWSTATFASTYAVSTILYASSSNVITGLATTNNASLSTNATGVPTWLALTNGQIVVGSTSGAPAATTLTAGNGITITNASNSITVSGTGGGMSWTEVTGTSSAMAADNGYISSNAGLVTLTLPATAALGTTISVAGKGAGGWLIAQNALQSIQIGSGVSTIGVGGSVASTNQWDSVNLLCVTANTKWVAIGAPQSGGLTIV